MNKKEKKYLDKFTSNVSEEDIHKIDEKLSSMEKGALKKVWEKVKALYQMIKDPSVSWVKKAAAIGALVYVISPIDAIPDVIPVLGLTDDAAVIMAVVAMLGNELRKYLIKNNID